MKVAVAAEVDAGEPRVAATPETIKKMIVLGADVAVEPGAGVKSGILDADYSAAGATVAKDAVNGADIVLKVRRPQASELSRYKRGAITRPPRPWRSTRARDRASPQPPHELGRNTPTARQP